MRNEERSPVGKDRRADSNNGKAMEPATVTNQAVRGDRVQDDSRDGGSDRD